MKIILFIIMNIKMSEAELWACAESRRDYGYVWGWYRWKFSRRTGTDTLTRKKTITMGQCGAKEKRSQKAEAYAGLPENYLIA